MPQNYILHDLYTYITTDLGFSNVFIDYEPLSPDDTTNSENIILMSEPSPAPKLDRYERTQNIGIYVKRKVRNEAREDCETIEYALTKGIVNGPFQGFLTTTGTPVYFHDLHCETPTSFYGTDKNYYTTFMCRFQAIVKDNRLNTTTYSK